MRMVRREENIWITRHIRRDKGRQSESYACDYCRERHVGQLGADYSNNETMLVPSWGLSTCLRLR